MLRKKVAVVFIFYEIDEQHSELYRVTYVPIEKTESVFENVTIY